jgi:hypothetical protein
VARKSSSFTYNVFGTQAAFDHEAATLIAASLDLAGEFKAEIIIGSLRTFNFWCCRQLFEQRGKLSSTTKMKSMIS